MPVGKWQQTILLICTGIDETKADTARISFMLKVPKIEADSLSPRTAVVGIWGTHCFYSKNRTFVSNNGVDFKERFLVAVVMEFQRWMSSLQILAISFLQRSSAMDTCLVRTVKPWSTSRTRSGAKGRIQSRASRSRNCDCLRSSSRTSEYLLKQSRRQLIIVRRLLFVWPLFCYYMHMQKGIQKNNSFEFNFSCCCL